MFNKLKAKLLASTGSATMGVAGTVVAIGLAAQQYPAILDIIPVNYRPLALAILGVIIAVARLRTINPEVK